MKITASAISTIKSNLVLHSHDEWEIIFNISGVIDFIIDDTKYAFRENDIAVIPPNVKHEGIIKKAPYTNIFVRADKMDFDKLLLVRDYDNTICTLMHFLHRVWLEKDNDKNNIIIATKLLDAIMEYIKKYHFENYKYPFINDLKNMIYENISNHEFNFIDASNKLGYNWEYLRQCFNAEIGKTPHEYLADLRLSRALDLLHDMPQAYSIKAISAMCGYNDQFYFSRVFKKHYGVSPKKMQQRNK